jgi:mannose-6-phosphate isomerase-like protein (cupin superfamily)
MYVKDRQDCREIRALDATALRELLNPVHEAGLPIRFSLAEARVAPGRVTLPHRLKSSEVYYLLEGEGEMRIDKESRTVGPGQAVVIPPGSVQSIKNTGSRELVFLCLVDPAWRAEDEELVTAGPGP